MGRGWGGGGGLSTKTIVTCKNILIHVAKNISMWQIHMFCFIESSILISLEMIYWHFSLFIKVYMVLISYWLLAEESRLRVFETIWNNLILFIITKKRCVSTIHSARYLCHWIKLPDQNLFTTIIAVWNGRDISPVGVLH